MNTINDFASKIIREFRKSYQMTILIKNVLLSFYLDRIRSMLMFRTHHRWNSISELTRANNHNYFSAPEFSRDFKGLTIFFCFQYFSTVAHITTGTRLTDTEQFLRMPFFREVGVGVTSILMPTRFGQQMNAPCQNIVLVYLPWPYMNLAIP